MKTFYGTFGQGQYLGLLKNYYVIIHAYDFEAAMELMKEAFGNKYSMVREGLPSMEYFENKLGILTQQS